MFCIYSITTTQQHLVIGHTKNSWDMKHEPICKMGSDRMLLSYAYHKPCIVKLPEKCGYQNGFNPDNKRGMVWYAARSRTKKVTGAACIDEA